MMRAAAAFALLAGLAGCAAKPVDGPEAAVPPAASGSCDATKAQALLGKRATPALIERARRSSGAAVARTLRPGEMVTMEFRADRLSIAVDAGETITAIRCG
ncbi:I78 family peptidase inhibitor [Sphingomonas profundi]|uniref:I78 family peptidase inhibitor n=1 Tax=Alterirhizorhabdus profundi TaxID=2681549 RepID=UPI0012E86190|nr:I78 family peptidase inhibitor [Sphingomonas profundi]